MLEAIVQYDGVDAEAGAGLGGGVHAAFAREDGPGEAVGEHHGLVAALLRRYQRPPVDAHHHHPRTSLAIAAGDDADAVPATRQRLRQPERGRRLAGSADGEVADAQHAGIHPDLLEPARVVQAVADRHRRAVRERRRNERQPKGALARGTGLPRARDGRHDPIPHTVAAHGDVPAARRSSMSARCRTSAPSPSWMAARARRPISSAAAGSASSRPSAAASSSVESTRTPPPAARMRSTVSAIVAVCGPTSTGRAARAGSRTLWPPAGTRLPPTKVAVPSP